VSSMSVPWSCTQILLLSIGPGPARLCRGVGHRHQGQLLPRRHPVREGAALIPKDARILGDRSIRWGATRPGFAARWQAGDCRLQTGPCTCILATPLTGILTDTTQLLLDPLTSSVSRLWHGETRRDSRVRTMSFWLRTAISVCLRVACYSSPPSLIMTDFTDQSQTGMTDPTGHVYRLSPAGKLDALLTNGPSPNGLILSPDEKVGSVQGQRSWSSAEGCRIFTWL
jgi:hypothetical protein